MDGPKLGAALKVRLDQLGWSQHGFVRRVNNLGGKLSSGYLSQLINGQVQSVGSEKLQAFAMAFGITVDQLLDASIPTEIAALRTDGIPDPALQELSALWDEMTDEERQFMLSTGRSIWNLGRKTKKRDVPNPTSHPQPATG